MIDGMRIVSLIASATEIVCALGLEDRLVGRSHECDHPVSIRGLPALSEPRLEPERPSRAIDGDVRRLLAEAVSVYRVDEAALRRLRPDVVITQSQCDVCAVSLKDVERALGERLEGRPRLVSLEPRGLEDVLADIRRVAAALGVPERGDDLVRLLRGRLEEVARRAAALAARPTVACIEWIDPLMAAGNWVPEMVGMAGGVNLFGEAGRHSPWMTWDEMLARDPEVVVVLPCGFDVPRSRREMPALASRPGWQGLSAVRAGRVFLADGNRYFNRPGPRLADSLEILAEILHPGTFGRGHEGDGWERFP